MNVPPRLSKITAIQDGPLRGTLEATYKADLTAPPFLAGS